MARTIGPVGPYIQKTYGSESLMTRGYAVTSGVADGNATAITAAGQRAVGILKEDVLVIGAPASVTRVGDEVGIAGAAIPYGSYVKADALGRLVPIAGTAGEEVIGRAESTAAALGDEVLVFVLPSVR
jgi:hypothetical protein